VMTTMRRLHPGRCASRVLTRSVLTAMPAGAAKQDGRDRRRSPEWTRGVLFARASGKNLWQDHWLEVPGRLRVAARSGGASRAEGDIPATSSLRRRDRNGILRLVCTSDPIRRVAGVLASAAPVLELVWNVVGACPMLQAIQRTGISYHTPAIRQKMVRNSLARRARMPGNPAPVGRRRAEFRSTRALALVHNSAGRAPWPSAKRGEGACMRTRAARAASSRGA
jgi:hypothetical protein